MCVGCLKPGFGMRLGVDGPEFCTALGTAVALINAEKDMSLKISHASFYFAYDKARRRVLVGKGWLAIMSIHIRKINGQTSKQK